MPRRGLAGTVARSLCQRNPYGVVQTTVVAWQKGQPNITDDDTAETPAETKV
jgi:hypothetical protein